MNTGDLPMIIYLIKLVNAEERVFDGTSELQLSH